MQIPQASLVSQTVKNPPAMWETWVRSLGWEDSLENDMATHTSILAGESPWTEEAGGLRSMGSQRVGQDWATNSTTHANIPTLTCNNTGKGILGKTIQGQRSDYSPNQDNDTLGDGKGSDHVSYLLSGEQGRDNGARDVWGFIILCCMYILYALFCVFVIFHNKRAKHEVSK